MPDTKISADTAASTLGSADLIPIVQGGLNKSATRGLIVPNAGTIGQVLAKNSATDFDYSWSGVLNNFTATTAPTASNDTTQGYAANSRWFNVNSGVIWVCRSAATGAAVWVRQDNADFFGFVAGRYALDFGVAQVSAGSALAATTMRLYPFIIKERHTQDTMGVRFTTASAAGNAAAAIYAAGSSRFATGTPLISSANLSSAAIGAVQGAAAYTFDPGLYWAATMADNTTAVCTAAAGTAPFALQVIGTTTLANSGGAFACLNYSTTYTTYGTWPDLTAVTLTETLSSSGASWLVQRHVSATF